MNRKDDFEKFSKMLVKINRITPGKDITPDAVDGYFRCCEDLDFKFIENNCFNYVKMVGFFPKVPDMRGETQEDIELQAQADLDMIRNLCDMFVFDGFGQTGHNILKMKLEEKGRSDLLPFINRWGYELVYSDNPTSTRAQALKALKAEKTAQILNKLPEKNSKELKGHIDKLTDSFKL
jgi:hypothetical protein